MSVIKNLINTLPKGIVISGSENTRPFECDGLNAYKQQPLAVVLPENVEQVKTAIKICRENNTAIVTRGSATGLSGGATPIEGSVILGLSKLKNIISIDSDRRLAVVEPGVRNIAVSEAASKYNLYYAPDPSSQIACSIGGNIAENAGGVHCLKYGLTVNNVESIKMLNVDGEEIILSRQDDGMGLLALMTGSEGLLGIIVEVTLKLNKSPALARVVMAGFDSVRDCANSVADIIKAGVIPAGLEMMDKLAIHATEDFTRAGYPLDAEALLLCELDGNEDDVISELNIVTDILSGANSLVVSNNEHERLTYWKGRKSAFPAIGRISPDYYCMDGTIPRRHLAEMLEKITKLSESYGLKVANVFHAGDGNLHPLIMYDGNIDGDLRKAEDFGNDIAKLSVDMGGSITGEHGVGVEKLEAMHHQFSEKELDIFLKIKNVFDSESLLNPGKAIPILNRCVETGGLSNISVNSLERT
jgi:glycolate oxidase